MARLMEQIVGHTEVKTRLLEMIQDNEFFSGAVFAGPEGVGKRQVALACLQELNCESSPACGTCASCERLSQPEAMEFLYLIEPEGGKIKVDQVRELMPFLNLQSWAKHRFVIIDQVETINIQAANALLKSLEEPPSGVHFILVSSSLSRVLPTLRSRCQIVQFGSLAPEQLKTLCPELEDWQAIWSLGRLSLARKLVTEEWSTLRKVALNYLHAPSNQEVNQTLLKELSSSEHIDFISHCWVSYLRDAMMYSQGLEDGFYNKDIASFIADFSENKDLVNLTEKIYGARRDLSSNVDKALVIENLAYDLGATVG